MGFMERLIDSIKPMGSVDAYWLKQVLYNTEFGLFNHMSPVARKEPLAAVRAFREEDPMSLTWLHDVAYRYYENRIYDYFKMTLQEYMRLPMPYSRQLDRIANETIAPLEAAKNQRTNEIAKQMLGDLGSEKK